MTDGESFAPTSISGRPVVGDHGATLCHRGNFTIDGGLPAMQYQPAITYTPVRGPVWSASDGVYRTIFLEGEQGVVCFDTFFSPGAAVAYRKAVGRVFPHKPIHTVVYSHDHLDHTGYALDLAPGAEVIAHDDCAEVVRLRASDGQAPATEAWGGEWAEYEIDGVRFELINPGYTHGNGNVAAWFEEQRLLFMVDNVAAGVGYTFYPDTHMASYLPSMRRLEELDFDLFVPGHFWPLGRDEFRASLEYFEFLTAAGEQALLDGVDPDHYAEIVSYADDRYRRGQGQLFRFDEYFAMNLMRAMLHALSGGWGLEDRGAAEERHGETDPSARRLPDPPPTEHPGGIGRPPSPRSGGADEPSLEVEAVGPGLWTAADEHGRAAFARGEEGIVAFNTFGSPQAASAYRRAIESVAPEAPIAAIVLTIDHADRAGFATGLAPDAPLVAHELCARSIAARGTVPDTIVAGDGETLEIAGLELELRYRGPTVGSGNLACRFPSADAIFVVGPRADARYGQFPDWHVEHYARTMRALLELPFETVIPGGGPLTDRAGLERAIAYFESLQWVTQKAYATGIPIWDLRAIEEYAVEILREEYGDLDGFRDHVGIGAFRVVHHYVMGGWGLEDTQRPESLLAAGTQAR